MAIHNCRPSGFSMYNRIIDSHCCGGGGNNYGSIYNIKYNCGGGTNFWGGLGLGLGAGFGNLFGSMFGGFGNGLSGLFGGFGMGMPGMFGGWGNGLASLWGGGASGAGNSNTDYVSKYSSNKSKSTCSCDGCGSGDKKTTDPTDADCKKIADFQAEINGLSKPITQDKYADLESRIKAAIKASENDVKNKDANLKSYDELLKQLAGFKPNTALEEKPVTPGGVTTPETPVNPLEGKRTVKINGKDVELDKLTPDQIKTQLTKEQIEGLTPDEAKSLLEKLGLLCKDDSNRDGVEATTNLNALRLTKQADLPLACGHNTSLDQFKAQGALPYLSGMISDINYNEETKMITFNLEDDKGKYQMKCIADSTTITLVKELANKDDTNYEAATSGIDYSIVTTDDDPYAIRTGTAAKRKK